MKRYWKMVLNKATKKGEIMLYGMIGESFWGGDGTTAKQFVQDLKDLGDVEQLDIRINSPGGLVSDGVVMYNNLKAHKAKKTVYVDGEASSIASVIAMAGDSIVMPENAWMMIHDPMTISMGNSTEMRKTADVLDKLRDGIVTAYRTKSALSEDDIKALMTAETWMLGKEAKEKGFCTDCVEELKAVACADFDHSKFKNTPKAITDSATIDALPPAIAGSGASGTPQDAGAAAASTAAVVPTAAAGSKTHPHPDPLPEGEGGTRKEIVNMNKCKVCGSDHAEGTACPVCAERARVQAIMAAGKKYNLDALAAEFVATGKSEQDFNKSVLDAMDKGEAILTGSAAGAKAAPASGSEPFRNLGEQLQVIRVHAKNPGGKPDTRLLQIMDAASGASEGVDSDGGFMVQQTFIGPMEKEMMENSNLLAKCFNVPVGAGSNGIWLTYIEETSRANGSRFGGVQVYRVAEAEAVTAKKPKIGKEYMALEKMMGLCYMTEESMQDAVALGALMNKAFGSEFGFKNDDEIINGTGAGMMLGILKSPALVTIAKETGQAAATIVAENIVKMYAAATPRTKGNGVWLVNSEVWQQLPLLTLPIGLGGVPIFMPPGGLSGAPYGTIFGRPVIEVEQCAALGTVGDIVFVDPAQYMTISKGGLNAISSIHVAFLTDQTAFKFTLRNNGQPLWRSALTPYKGSQTRSPYVALATRA